jgi:hypothetical protein
MLVFSYPKAFRAGVFVSARTDLGVKLATFGWFGSALFVMSVQNLAILADLISTFYKLGIVGS